MLLELCGRCRFCGVEWYISGLVHYFIILQKNSLYSYRQLHSTHPSTRHTLVTQRRENSQHRPPGHNRILDNLPVPPAGHERQDERRQNVREDGVEGPHGLCAARPLAEPVMARARLADLAGECGERALERGRGCVVLGRGLVMGVCGGECRGEFTFQGQSDTILFARR